MRRMRPVTLCGLAMLGLALGIGAASAEDKTFELKLSHWVPPSHPLQKAMEDWGASIEKDSGGTIKYKVYPAQQLGKAFDHYDMARDGIADVTYVSPGLSARSLPDHRGGRAAVHVGNAKGGIRGSRRWYRKYAEREMKDVKFASRFAHDPG
jgi:TRAP-type C4-dicarboxylate transport system substrate-binding protein